MKGAVAYNGFGVGSMAGNGAGNNTSTLPVASTSSTLGSPFTPAKPFSKGTENIFKITQGSKMALGGDGGG